MKRVIVLVLLLICLDSTVHATSGLGVDAALRPVRPWIAELVSRAVGVSPTLDRLLRRLVSSAVIVHVDDDVPSGAAFDGRTRFVGASGSLRYIRVDLRRSPCDHTTAGLLAHELQHVAELLDGDVWDVHSFRALFQRIGTAQPSIGPHFFETSEAVTIGLRTARELAARPAWFVTGDTHHHAAALESGARCRKAPGSQ